MKIFHLFLLIFLYAGCTSPNKKKVDQLDKELDVIPILSLSFDSVWQEVLALPATQQSEILLRISKRKEEEIDGLLKQKNLITKNLPLASKKVKKKILLQLLEIYLQLALHREQSAEDEGLRISEDLEVNYSLSQEERWKIKKIKAELLNKRGLHEEFLPIWFELLAEHREANRPALIIEDLSRITNYFVILGDREKGISLCKEAYQLAVDNNLPDWKHKCLINLIRLLYDFQQYAEVIEYYKNAGPDSVSLSQFTYPILAACYLQLKKTEQARFYLSEMNRTMKVGNGMSIYCRIAETYIAENKEDSAFVFFKKAMEQSQKQLEIFRERNIKASLPFSFLPVTSSLAALYQNKGKNLQANELFTLVEPLMKKPTRDRGRLEMQVDALLRYSTFYKVTGHYKEALDLLIIRDSLQQIIHTIREKREDKNLMERLQMKDLMHTIEMQKTELIDSHRLLTALGACAFLSLSLVAAIIHIFNQRRKRLAVINSQEKETKRLRSVPSSRKSIPQNPQEILFQAAQKKVLSEKLYQNSDLTLEGLAQKLNTNRTYLSACINICAGCNFNQWINNFRVDYIVKHIRSGQKLTVLAEKAGFVSTDSFYRNFKRKTHLTPHEYLKQQTSAKNDDSL